MFAIIEVGARQYKVKPGQTLSVDKLDGNVGTTVTVDRVLMVSDGKKTTVGTPLVPNTVVKAKIVEHYKGEKIDIRRFKSKVRYRKSKGFRAQLSKIEIVSIGRA